MAQGIPDGVGKKSHVKLVKNRDYFDRIKNQFKKDTEFIAELKVLYPRFVSSNTCSSKRPGESLISESVEPEKKISRVNEDVEAIVLD